jgi:hypothetical protein
VNLNNPRGTLTGLQNNSTDLLHAQITGASAPRILQLSARIQF